jgi:hypothetical protein
LLDLGANLQAERPERTTCELKRFCDPTPGTESLRPGAAVAARGQTESIRDHLQQLLPRVVDRAEATDVAGLHVRIGVQTQGGEALALDLPCSLDTGADRRRGFAVNRVGQVRVQEQASLGSPNFPQKQGFEHLLQVFQFNRNSA